MLSYFMGTSDCLLIYIYIYLFAGFLCRSVSSKKWDIHEYIAGQAMHNPDNESINEDTLW